MDVFLKLTEAILAFGKPKIEGNPVSMCSRLDLRAGRAIFVLHPVSDRLNECVSY